MEGNSTKFPVFSIPCLRSKKGRRGRGAKGPWSPKLFERVGFTETFILRRKIFGLKDEGFEFYRKIFEIATPPLLYSCNNASVSMLFHSKSLLHSSFSSKFSALCAGLEWCCRTKDNCRTLGMQFRRMSVQRSYLK